MLVSKIVLVDTSQPGNLGSAMRVAANFGVPEVALVRPATGSLGNETRRWACGAEQHLEISVHDTFEPAVSDVRTVIASASGRGRENLPVVDVGAVRRELQARTGTAAVVFGNETRGLPRRTIDRCDFVVSVPTVEAFPVLNLAQAVAIITATLAEPARESGSAAAQPAHHATVEALMSHVRKALLRIGFLDPVNPGRILRKLRRIVGRASLTENDVAILHGICRQVLWAANGATKRPTLPTESEISSTDESGAHTPGGEGRREDEPARRSTRRNS